MGCAPSSDKPNRVSPEEPKTDRKLSTQFTKIEKTKTKIVSTSPSFRLILIQVFTVDCKDSFHFGPKTQFPNFYAI